MSSSRKKRVRRANYTPAEKSLLIDLIMQYKHIIEDKRMTGIYFSKKREAWESIQRKYNSYCSTGPRHIEQLKILYDNLKQNLEWMTKKEYLQSHEQRETQDEDSVMPKDLENIQMDKTGGSSWNLNTINSDTKILSINQDQVESHSNPCGSEALDFKDTTVVQENNRDLDLVTKPQTTDVSSTPTTEATSKSNTPATAKPSETTSKFSMLATTTTPSAKSILCTAVASPAKTTSPSQATSIFAAAEALSAQALGATQGSFFGTTSTASSNFGTSTDQSVFNSATTKPSVLSTPASAFLTSVFGTVAPESGSISGSAVTQASVFPTTTTPQASTSSVFGSSSSTFVFGTAPPLTQASVFRSTAPKTQSSVLSTTQASLFGGAPMTQTLVFVTTPTTTVRSRSLFGGADINLLASASISTTSAPSPTSGRSIFGGGSPGLLFGSSNTNVFCGKTIFGQSNPTAAAIFGGGGATSFGQKPATKFWSGGYTTGETGIGSSGFVAEVPVKKIKLSSAESFKRLYFKRKCENAKLERKKILTDIFNNQQEHKLKMLILKKTLEDLNKKL